MAPASERVEDEGAPGGRKARIEVPHVGCKLAAKVAKPLSYPVRAREHDRRLDSPV